MKKILLPSPIGFKAGGINCGVKKSKKDLALIYSEVSAVCAGMFTTNQIKAAPVRLTKETIANGQIQAIIANSGNANCVTGPQGDYDALEMARAVSQALIIDISKVAVASTGSIGKPLPIKKIVEGVEILGKKISREGFGEAAKAILTTDTKPKCISKQILLSGKTVTMTAMAKGAGMIHPNMATMLCFIATDAKITHPMLKAMLKKSIDNSFNCISVDGCRSTNDTVLIMANGMADNPIIDTQNLHFNMMQNELNIITKELASAIVMDGEGATKIIEITVTGAKSDEDAKNTAFSIANYNLLKCSFFAEVLNIGRIMAAIGACPATIDPEKINIYAGDFLVLNNGQFCPHIGSEIQQLLKQKKICIKVELNIGEGNATVWTSDLTPKYVKINMD